MHPQYRQREILPKETGITLARKMFSTLAWRILQENEAVQQVNCGENSGISSSVGVPLNNFNHQLVQKFKDYDKYSDATSQHIIAHQEDPYLLYQKIDAKSFHEVMHLFIEKQLKETSEVTEFVSIKALKQFCEYTLVTNPLPELYVRAFEIVKAKSPAMAKKMDAFKIALENFVAMKEKLFDPLTNQEEAEGIVGQLQRLKENGMNINIASKAGTLLTEAIQKIKNAELLKKLIEIADANAKDTYGNTPLKIALYNAAPEIILALLEKGADANAKNTYGNTPLILALICNPAPEIILALLEKGAEINRNSISQAKDKPVLLSILQKHIAQKAHLICQAASPSKDSLAPLMIIALEAGVGLKTILALLEKGADANAKGTYGKTPLIIALENNAAPEIILALLEKGADANAKNTYGDSLLTIAVIRNLAPEIILALLDKGAEINEEILSIAKYKPELLAILKKHMAQKALLEHQSVASPEEVPAAPLALLRDTLIAVALSGNESQQDVAELLLTEAPSSPAFTPLRDALPVVAMEEDNPSLREAIILPPSKDWWHIL